MVSIFTNVQQHKTLLMGLSNSGKTSVLQYLKGIRNLPAYSEIKPTKNISYVFYQAVDYDSVVWDFGGQERYIKRYLEDFYSYIEGTDRILFVIDIQDEKKYEPAINYLKNIIELCNNKECEKIEFLVYLHKYDPDLSHTRPDITEKKIESLVKKIKQLFPKTFNFKISKTSIYATFNEVSID